MGFCVDGDVPYKTLWKQEPFKIRFHEVVTTILVFIQHLQLCARVDARGISLDRRTA